VTDKAKTLAMDLIAGFGRAPESQLDPDVASACAHFDGDDPIRFLRNMVDVCVHGGLSSDFVVAAADMVLRMAPEDFADKDARRDRLESGIDWTEA
jgi:hypothetical protein